jgi:hypothetical protein
VAIRKISWYLPGYSGEIALVVQKYEQAILPHPGMEEEEIYRGVD